MGLFGLGLSMPAIFADEFGTTARIATPSLKGFGRMAIRAKTKKDSYRITLKFLKISLNLLAMGLPFFFSFKIQADNADILDPCRDHIDGKPYQDDR